MLPFALATRGRARIRPSSERVPVIDTFMVRINVRIAHRTTMIANRPGPVNQTDRSNRPRQFDCRGLFFCVTRPQRRDDEVQEANQRGIAKGLFANSPNT